MARRETRTVRDRPSEPVPRFSIMDLKHQAAEYYRSNEVPQRLEEVLNTMFYQRPGDLYGYLPLQHLHGDRIKLLLLGSCFIFMMVAVSGVVIT